MAHMQITVIPVGTGTTSVGDYVADIERYLMNKGIEHTLHDMGTILSGPADELLRLAEEIHSLPFSKGAQRVVTSITLDDRRDVNRGLGDKKKAVTKRLQGERGK